MSWFYGEYWISVTAIQNSTKVERGHDNASEKNDEGYYDFENTIWLSYR